MTPSHDDATAREQAADNRVNARRGFASMDRDKQRSIASQGGIAAHRKGTAHHWTTDEARLAGQKGGKAKRTRVVPRATPD